MAAMAQREYRQYIDGLYYDLDYSSREAAVSRTIMGESYQQSTITIPSNVNYKGTTFSVTSIGISVFLIVVV